MDLLFIFSGVHPAKNILCWPVVDVTWWLILLPLGAPDHPVPLGLHPEDGGSAGAAPGQGAGAGGHRSQVVAHHLNTQDPSYQNTRLAETQ